MDFLLTLGAGILGGLILNIMPCVLPGLFMKARGVIFQLQSGESFSTQRLEGLSYFLGSLATFTFFACAVVIFRASGESLGQGMQMQEPLFVGGLIVVTFLFGLSSFDVFKINLGVTQKSGQKTKLVKSFLDGVFITLISTPCSAPILGGAVTVALANESTWWQTLSLFWAISFGLCLPILAISFYPRASRFVPRHGEWMEHFKTLVGVTLMAVCVWLYTIYEQILESRDQAPRILYALCAIAGLFILTKLWSERSRGVRLGLNTIALLMGGWVLNWSAHPPVEYLNWRPFDEATLTAELSAGRPVFVDFTAEWCVSCKTFEALYLNKPTMAELFRERGVTPLKVDLTDPNNPHWALLKSFNRTGIPAYLLYPPEGEPILLPEGPPLTLTSKIKAFPLRSTAISQSEKSQESTP